MIESKLISDSTQLWETWQPNQNALPIVNRLNEGKLIRAMGPCSLQSLVQATSILDIVGDYIDAGRDNDKKPRTRPVRPDGTPLSHGLGHDAAIPILQSIHERYPNLALGVETMSRQDVLTLAATGLLGFNWSGSRTQEQETLIELGEASAQTNTLMMIKNPLVPDIEMFMGMMENWILGSGMALPFICILRGDWPFKVSDRRIWRARPNLDQIPILKSAFPKLPIIVDPSHMVKATKDPDGIKKRLNTVVGIVQKAVDLGANGYMCEVNHPDHPSLTDQGEDAYNLLNKLVQKGLA